MQSPLQNVLLKACENKLGVYKHTNTLGTNWRCVRGRDEAIEQQGAASIPGILWAATAPQPALTCNLHMVVQRLDLLSSQVEPAPLFFMLWKQIKTSVICMQTKCYLYLLIL